MDNHVLPESDDCSCRLYLKHSDTGLLSIDINFSVSRDTVLVMNELWNSSSATEQDVPEAGQNYVIEDSKLLD